MNVHFIIGNLGANPDSRYDSEKNRYVTRLDVATNEYWRDGETGEKRSKTSWHKVVLRGTMAENAARYLVKGSQVGIFGRSETRSYQEAGVTKYITELQAEKMEMLDSRNDNDEVPASVSTAKKAQPSAASKSLSMDH